MRGKYNMSDLELKGWSKTILKIIEDFKSTKGYCSQDLTKLNLCPANVVTILENLNWTLNSFDSNGWQQDTWYTFFHEDYIRFIPISLHFWRMSSGQMLDCVSPT